MYLLQKARNVLRAMKQKWGTDKVKRALWNREFATGHWHHLENTAGDVIYEFIEKYASNRSILDLGCGSGNTACELKANAYRDYTGVDISDVAVEQASARSQAAQRGQQNRFFRGDIASYTPGCKYDVILFRESIYYLPKGRIKPTLERYGRYLTEDGVFIVRCSVREDGEAILALLGNEFRVVEKYSPTEGPLVAVLSLSNHLKEDGKQHVVSTAP